VVTHDPFVAVAAALDLAQAAAGLDRNDLLPPRREDKVGGELGKRLTEALTLDLSSGRYEPDTATIVPVPKQGLTTRPAALLTLRDRVVYDALVAPLRSRIEAALVASSVVFWPRGSVSPKRWRDFDLAPSQTGHSYVALLDIAGFYESIDHARLAEALIMATGRREVVLALVEFLRRVMGGGRGLPQGLGASDPLATAYLAPLDRAMLREGFDYFRNGDDVRIAVSSYADGLRAVALAEEHARGLDLNLNSSKCRVLKMETYKAQLAHVEAAKTELRGRLEQIKFEAIDSGDQDEIDRVLEQLEALPPIVGLEDLGREVWLDIITGIDGPYETGTVEERIDFLRQYIQPTDTQLACSLFEDSIARSPDQGLTDSLSPEEFHERIRDSLLTLAAAKEPCAIDGCARLLRSYPAETELVTKYLDEVLATDRDRVLAVVVEVLLEDQRHRTAWQDAWLFWLLQHAKVF
jgi:hypothetical protein